MSFYKLFSLATISYYGVSVSIVVLSFLVRILAMWLVKFITFKSESKRSFLVIIFIFLVCFNNYGIVYLIAPLKLSIPILNYFFVGIYPDFNYAWYDDIGGLIISVSIINAIMPPLMLIVDVLLKNV